MGNQSSKNSSGGSTSPVAGHHSPAVSAHDREKKVNRRVSIQALSSGKATAADPSASKASATAQAISNASAQKTNLQQHLATHSPDLNVKSPSLERPRSRETPKLEKYDLEHRPKDVSSSEPSGPMKVPTATVERSSKQDPNAFQPSGPPTNSYYTPAAQLRGPPRLPLPIAENDHVPGSPLTGPLNDADDDISMFEDDESALPQREISMLSSTTVEEDEVADDAQPVAVDMAVPTKVVPTVITWKGTGEKVYVTGTFANWEKKFKLHRNQTNDGLSTILNFPPGTHHLKFIVDGDMRLSDELPTTVEENNYLVNYIEVSADHIPRPRRESDRGKAAVPDGVYPPQTLPDYDDESPVTTPEPDTAKPIEPPEEEIPAGDFRMLFPQALVNIELEDADPTAYHDAANIIQEMAPPPSLPMFLNKSILNGTTPIKDDNSVLNYPNHTVLNHLATSSIKNNVLATSVTTRYKRKYVTTIMYKPTLDIEP